MATSGPSAARLVVCLSEKDTTRNLSPGPRILVLSSQPVGRQPDQVHSLQPSPGAFWTATAFALRFEFCPSALWPGFLLATLHGLQHPGFQ